MPPARTIPPEPLLAPDAATRHGAGSTGADLNGTDPTVACDDIRMWMSVGRIEGCRVNDESRSGALDEPARTRSAGAMMRRDEHIHRPETRQDPILPMRVDVARDQHAESRGDDLDDAGVRIAIRRRGTRRPSCPRRRTIVEAQRYATGTRDCAGPTLRERHRRIVMRAAARDRPADVLAR